MLITIVEDQKDFREALVAILGLNQDYVVHATYDRAETLLEHLANDVANIYMLDINLPGIDGIELLRRVKKQYPNRLYLMCTSYDDEEHVFAALKAGAHGYLLKNSSAAQIWAALAELKAGGAPMSSGIARKVIGHFHDGGSNTVVQQLSPRENEVLQLLAKGHIYKEVAAQLGISVETVRKHCYSLYEKLHVDNRMEAVNKYLGR